MSDIDDASRQDSDWVMFKLAWEHYEKDLGLFWTRANFFLFFEGALVAFLAQLAKDIGGSGSTDFAIYAVVVLGLLTSLVWGWVLLSSLSWISHWRRIVHQFEHRLASRVPQKPVMSALWGACPSQPVKQPQDAEAATASDVSLREPGPSQLEDNTQDTAAACAPDGSWKGSALFQRFTPSRAVLVLPVLLCLFWVVFGVAWKV